MYNAFEKELAELNRFTEILQREQAALVKADVVQLIKISEEKIQQAERLNQLARERLAMLHAAGISDDPTTIQAWLESQPPKTSDAWNRLLHAAKAAQQLNQTNGKLIETQLQHNQQALNALISAANQSAVYGADGQARTLHPGSQRTLGKG